jgi:hypothetical protein
MGLPGTTCQLSQSLHESVVRQFDQRKFYPTFAFDIGILYRTLDCKNDPPVFPVVSIKLNGSYDSSEAEA